MDFTATYDHAAAECVSFSPGSTFIAYIDGERQSAVQVRVSGTLQVVRSWELGTPLQALSWSPDGLFLLACAYTVPGRDERNGRSYILPLDPDASVTDGSDDGQGWVARIDAGIGGLQQAEWVPVWRVPSIVQFASYETGGVMYSLADQAFTALPGTLLSKAYAHPLRSDAVGFLQRDAESDYFALYAPESADAPSMQQPVSWKLERVRRPTLIQSIKLHVSEPSGAAWSPDGHVLAVWDSALEYRVALYALAGTHLATFAIDAESSVPTTQIAIAPADAKAALAESGSGPQRARRVPMRTSRFSKSASLRASTSQRKSGASIVARVAGGGLGVRHVAWHPSSAFLAIGGYDERVRILSSEDWSEVYTLDVRRIALAAHRPDVAVWREPRRWFEATQGQGIVPFERDVLPMEAPAARQDQSNPTKCGVCWMEWNWDGTVLAVRNEALPMHVLLYVFDGVSERRTDARLRLHAVLKLSSPVHALSWKPGQYGTLAIVTGKSAVYLYSLQRSGAQSAEAVAIPNEHFSAMRLAWSPDGQALLLLDSDTYCCAMAAPENTGDS